ncbi:MAG: hypothetical protein PHW52_00725 [Candidatus Pacebacteria bacterium]|nr:hypothetical protein [Candidatus Paceibacterota bacterium]
MEEYKVIKTLEAFKQKRPDNNWANFAKREIISQSFDKSPVSFWEVLSVLRTGLASSKLAVGASLSAVLAIFLIVIATNNYDPSFSPVATKPLSPEERLLAAIRSTETEMDKIPLTAKDNGEVDVKEIKMETRKALASASEQLKGLPKEQKVAFADKVVSKVKDLEKNANAVIMDEYEDKTAIQEFYKVIAENEIKEFDANINNLTDEQKVILSKAKDFFAIGKYDKSVEEIYKIQAKINIDNNIDGDKDKKEGSEDPKE